jgi:hypothetical protein
MAVYYGGNAINSFLRSIQLVILSALLTAPANAAVSVDINRYCDVVADDSEGGTKEGEEEPDCE